MDHIDDAYHLAAVAAHEAGHAIVVSSEGGELNSAEVSAHDGGGEVRYTLPRNNPEMRAAIHVAGAIAEGRFLRRDWHRLFRGTGDEEKLVHLAESAGVGYERLMQAGVKRAKAILDRRWPEVRQLAGRILESGGKLTFRKQETDSFRRLQESAARISAQLFEAGDTDTGWITIGGHRGADGKKHGGTPVKIKGGKIVSGPKGLAGKTLRGLSKVKPHAELRRAIDKAHKEHGFSKSDIADAIEFVHGERKRIHDERESAKEAIRKATGLTAADISRVANSGHDYSSAHKMGGATGQKFSTFDEAAHNMAREYPDIGLGDADNPNENFSENLWNLLAEGKREAPAKHHADTVDEAIRLLHQNARYAPSEEEVPF